MRWRKRNENRAESSGKSKGDAVDGWSSQAAADETWLIAKAETLAGLMQRCEGIDEHLGTARKVEWEQIRLEAQHIVDLGAGSTEISQLSQGANHVLAIALEGMGEIDDAIDAALLSLTHIYFLVNDNQPTMSGEHHLCSVLASLLERAGDFLLAGLFLFQAGTVATEKKDEEYEDILPLLIVRCARNLYQAEDHETLSQLLSMITEHPISADRTHLIPIQLLQAAVRGETSRIDELLSWVQFLEQEDLQVFEDLAIRSWVGLAQSSNALREDVERSLRRLVVIHDGLDDPGAYADARAELALHLLESNPVEALDYAKTAFVVHNEFRQRLRNERLRSAALDRCRNARLALLHASCRQGDWPLLWEAIESSRQQSLPASTVEAAGERGEQVPDRFASTSPDSARARRKNSGAANIEVPLPFRYLMSTWLNSSAVSAVPVRIQYDDESILTRQRQTVSAQLPHLFEGAPINLSSMYTVWVADRAEVILWSMWLEDDLLFWTIALNGTCLSGGMITVSERLKEALQGLPGGTSVASDADDDDEGRELQEKINSEAELRTLEDLYYTLARSDSLDSIDLLGALSEVVPPPLRSLAASRSGRRSRLVISANSKLLGIPYPILLMDPDSDQVLLDVYDLFFSASAAAALSPSPADLDPDAVPRRLLLWCDSPWDDLEPLDCPSRAVVAFSSKSDSAGLPASALEPLMNVMSSLGHGESGVAFFRGHGVAGEMASETGVLLDDGQVLMAQHLLTRGIDEPINLPSHVVLSCCSTSGILDDSGGESLGLVSGCIAAGARRVVATLWDVVEGEFAQRLDRDILKVFEMSTDVLVDWSELQRSYLLEWRNIDPARAELGTAPNPAVWASYALFCAGASPTVVDQVWDDWANELLE